MTLRILTPAGESLCAETPSVRLPVPDGSYGVMDGHEPTLLLLARGDVVYRSAGDPCESRTAIEGGVARITGVEILVLTEPGGTGQN